MMGSAARGGVGRSSGGDGVVTEGTWRITEHVGLDGLASLEGDWRALTDTMPACWPTTSGSPIAPTPGILLPLQMR